MYSDCRAVILSKIIENDEKQEYIYDETILNRKSFSNKNKLSTESINMNEIINIDNLLIRNRKLSERKNVIVSTNSIDWMDVGGKYYAYQSMDYLLSSVTVDHSCLLASERQLVKSLTTDINPLRPSLNNIKAYGSAAPDRVAGSLAMTRSLGDMYLKQKELRLFIFKFH